MTPQIISSALFLAMALVCHLAEQKSRKWYQDRFLLRLQGYFVGAALIILLYP